MTREPPANPRAWLWRPSESGDRWTSHGYIIALSPTGRYVVAAPGRRGVGAAPTLHQAHALARADFAKFARESTRAAIASRLWRRDRRPILLSLPDKSGDE